MEKNREQMSHWNVLSSEERQTTDQPIRDICEEKLSNANKAENSFGASEPLPVRQLWNFKAFSRRKDFSQVLHLYLYSWSGCGGDMRRC